jgi:tight adherence protein B
MIPILLSCAFGAGVYLLYDGFTRPVQVGGPQPEGAQGVRRRSTGWALDRLTGVREFLVRAGLQGVTPNAFAVFAAGTGLACGLLAQLLLGWPLISLLALLAGAALPLAYYLHRHDHRRAAVQEALADAIAQLRDGIRSGLSVEEAMRGLAANGPEALREDFAALTRDARLHGFARAVETTRERLADPVFDTVAAALLLNDTLGGRNVSTVLDRLASATRAQLAVQQEIRAHQTRHVWAARIVAAVPVVVLVAIRGANPGYLAVFDSLWGQVLLAGCGLSIALGYAAMLWSTRVPGERRVLA